MEQKNKAPRLGENKMKTMPVGKLLFNMALPLALAVVLCFLLPVMGKKGLRIGVFVFEGLVLAANTVLYVLRLINR